MGTIADAGAVPGVVGKVKSDDAGVRKMAVYVLGALKDSSTIRVLQIALNDPVADVRWNAAMALAQMHDAAGADLLLRLTDRDYLAEFGQMSQEDRENVLVNAVRSLGILKLEGAREPLASLSRNDPSLTVRDAALEALGTY